MVQLEFALIKENRVRRSEEEESSKDHIHRIACVVFEEGLNGFGLFK